MDAKPDAGGGTLEIGRYKIIPSRREVLADGEPLEVGDRAFEVLLRLVEARGALVGKDDLLKAVWPSQSVEENALQAQISALRKALGAERDLIRTVSGQGYQLIAEVRAGLPAEPFGESSTIPQWMSELIGRRRKLFDFELSSRPEASRSVSTTTPAGSATATQSPGAVRMLDWATLKLLTDDDRALPPGLMRSCSIPASGSTVQLCPCLTTRIDQGAVVAMF
jgi:DNA-binding winged helix-turn-helix (wHTH) protein